MDKVLTTTKRLARKETLWDDARRLNKWRWNACSSALVRGTLIGSSPRSKTQFWQF